MSQPNVSSGFLPQGFYLPDDPETLRRFLSDYLLRAAQAVNNRDISVYDIVARINGQQYFTPGDATIFRSVYRLVVNFGALPNSTSKSVAHGITWTSAVPTIFTRIYATATNTGTPGPAIPIPYINTTTPANSVQLDVTTTNVVITTGADYTAYDTCYVVLEYIQ